MMYSSRFTKVRSKNDLEKYDSYPYKCFCTCIKVLTSVSDRIFINSNKKKEKYILNRFFLLLKMRKS